MPGIPPIPPIPPIPSGPGGAGAGGLSSGMSPTTLSVTLPGDIPDDLVKLLDVHVKKYIDDATAYDRKHLEPARTHRALFRRRPGQPAKTSSP